MFIGNQIPRTLLMVMLLLPMMLAGNAVAQDRIYRSVDKDGNPVFSDQGDESSKPVELPPTNTLPALAAPDATSPDRTEDSGKYYTLVAINSPANDETIINTGGIVNVVASVEPGMQDGHKVLLLVDGSAYGEAQTDISFELTDIARGTHSLQVQVVDSDGDVIEASSAVTVHIQQASRSARKAIPGIIGSTPR